MGESKEIFRESLESPQKSIHFRCKTEYFGDYDSKSKKIIRKWGLDGESQRKISKIANRIDQRFSAYLISLHLTLEVAMKLIKNSMNIGRKSSKIGSWGVPGPTFVQNWSQKWVGSMMGMTFGWKIGPPGNPQIEKISKK